MSTLSGFEKCALKAIVERTHWAGDAEEGISSLEVKERDKTTVGFYTTILHRAPTFYLIDANPQNPPTILVRHKKLVRDGIVTLWVTNSGSIEGIEAVSFASEEWPADADPSEFIFQSV